MNLEKYKKRVTGKLRWVGILGLLLLGLGIFIKPTMVFANTSNSSNTNKKLESITAEYTGSNIIVGSDINVSDVKVKASYSDGTEEEVTDFIVVNKKIMHDGYNTLIVVYNGKTVNLHVMGIKVDTLSAYYSGGSVVIGEDIDLSLVSVDAIYSDGTTVAITEFTMPNTKVTAEGLNSLVVVYGGKSSTISVVGIKVSSITALYLGGDISVGNAVDPRNLTVTANYSDGTQAALKPTEYKVYNNIVNTTGTQTAYVLYQGQKAEFTINGKSPLTLTSLSATYSGSGVSVGTSINPVDLYVVAVYTDGTTEVINNYVLTPSIIAVEGTTEVKVYFRGKSTTVNINGIPEKISSIEAKYIGESVVIGSSVRSQDVKVTATYDDGSKKEITEFNILGGTLTYTGSRTVTIEAGGCKDDIIVLCVSSKVADYSNAAEFEITNGYYTGSVAVDLTNTADETQIIGTSLERSEVRNLMRRVWKGCSFIAFDISLDDPDLIEEFPLTIKITLPDYYVASKTKFFYTTNRKSVIGEMVPTVESQNEISCVINNTGTYIIAYKAE